MLFFLVLLLDGDRHSIRYLSGRCYYCQSVLQQHTACLSIDVCHLELRSNANFFPQKRSRRVKPLRFSLAVTIGSLPLKTFAYAARITTIPHEAASAISKSKKSWTRGDVHSKSGASAGGLQVIIYVDCTKLELLDRSFDILTFCIAAFPFYFLFSLSLTTYAIHNEVHSYCRRIRSRGLGPVCYLNFLGRYSDQLMRCPKVSRINAPDPISLLTKPSILDACKATIQGQVNSCSQQDWGCLCEQYGNLITVSIPSLFGPPYVALHLTMTKCYNNCPGNLEVSSVQQQRDQYCNFASVYSSSTTKYSAVSTSATATSTSSSDDVAQTGFAAASGSESAKASTTASGNSAAATQIAANIAFAGVAVAYMFL